MATVNASRLQEGMEVYRGEEESLGRIERVDRDSITVGGTQYALTSIDRAAGSRVFLHRGAGTSGAAGQRAPREGEVGVPQEIVEAQGEVRVPEMEERLHVEKRQAELGEVQVRKTVTEEQQTVPVELQRDEVRVEKQDTEERAATETDLRGAFEEGTIRVPVRGEEAVVTKEAVVTGEVVIDKQLTTDRQEVSDTVRSVRVDVDEQYQRQREDFRKHYAQGRGAGGQRPFEDAEHTYRTGFEAAHDERHAGKRFEDVEPELRHQHERTAGASASADPWERLRDEVREGFHRGAGR